MARVDAVLRLIIAYIPESYETWLGTRLTTGSLPFSTDEFFAGIREFYNYRAEDPEL